MRVKGVLAKMNVKGTLCFGVLWGIFQTSLSLMSVTTSCQSAPRVASFQHPGKHRNPLVEYSTVNLGSHEPAGSSWASKPLILKTSVSMTETLIPAQKHNPVLGPLRFLLCCLAALCVLSDVDWKVTVSQRIYSAHISSGKSACFTTQSATWEDKQQTHIYLMNWDHKLLNFPESASCFWSSAYKHNHEVNDYNQFTLLIRVCLVFTVRTN